MGKLPKIFDSFFIKTSDKHNVDTRFATRTTFLVFQKFEQQTMFKYNGHLHYGIKLMRDNFKSLTPCSIRKRTMHAFHSSVLSWLLLLLLKLLLCFWCFCYLVLCFHLFLRMIWSPIYFLDKCFICQMWDASFLSSYLFSIVNIWWSPN